MSARIALAITVVLITETLASAHPLAPSLVHIALGDGVHDVTLRVSQRGRRPLFDSACVVTLLPPEPARGAPDLIVTRERWTCPADAALTLIARPGDPPVIVERAARGHVVTTVLDASHPRLALAIAEAPDAGTMSLLSRWLGLGFTHLLTGFDHVLVVLGLLALIGWRRRLVWALTAFTLGHSLALALGASGWVSLPIAAVEIAIAVTLVALGLELATPLARPGIIARHVWLGGLTIGLVHGLGFAGALAELLGDQDAPAPRIATALVGFNLGLELAQLALVAGMLVVVRVIPWRLAATRVRVAPRVATGWLIGIAGAAWVFDRAWP